MTGSGTITNGGVTGGTAGGHINNSTTNESVPNTITDVPRDTVPSGETDEKTETDIMSSKSGGKIEIGVSSGKDAETGKSKGLGWLWWFVPLVVGIGVVLWLMFGKKAMRTRMKRKMKAIKRMP